MIRLDQLPNHARNEKTELFLRRHWVELLIIGLYAFGLFIVPILIFLLFQIAGLSPFATNFSSAITMLLLSVYTLAAIIITLTQFTDYYLDTWIVTNERIIDIEQRGLFSRVVSELHLNQIQDVTSETHGLFGTVLTYGEVFIQTAGAKNRFHFKRIDDPEIVKIKITKLIEDDKRRHGDASKAG